MIRNLSRQQVEMMGKMGARVAPGRDGYSWAWVLNSFELNVWDQDTSLTPHLKNDGFWEAWITSWFVRNVQPGMVVFDIGANCGYYTMVAEQMVGETGQVYAFEPNPVYVQALKQTRLMNNANFSILPFAVGDEDASVQLFVPDNLTGGASVGREITVDTYNTVDVTQTTLDGLLEMKQITLPDIIKIDVEGHEEKVWEGMQTILNSPKRSVIVMEYTPRCYSDEFHQKMTDWGDISAINGDGMEVPVSKDYLDSINDWIMIVVRKR